MLEIILILAVLIADQVSKVLVENGIALGSSVPLWDGVFQLSNVHNTGAAWGMLSGARIAFLVVTPILCAALIWMLVRNRKSIGAWGRVCLSLLIAGALGNFIDRAILGYVRDMFDFCLIGFPVFNVADSAITIGAAMLCIDTLFRKNGSIFAALEQKKEPEQTEAAAAAEEIESTHE